MVRKKMECVGYPQAYLENRSKLYQFTEGCPLESLEPRRAYFVPGHNCLLDEEGRIILESLSHFGDADKTRGATEVRVDFSKLEFERRESLSMWLGTITGHWGHLLTNELARLWARDRVPASTPIILSKRSGLKIKHVQELVALCDPNLLGRIVCPDRPTRFERIVLPLPTFQSFRRIYRGHVSLFEQAAARALQSAPGESFRGAKVYLSRRNLPQNLRQILNEEELCSLLGRAGYREVFPESLSVVEQVAMFNLASVIVGCQGSAFHTGICSESSSLQVGNICHSEVNPKFMMIDELRSYRVTYLAGTRKVKSTDREGSLVNQVLDMPRVEQLLGEAGLV